MPIIYQTTNLVNRKIYVGVHSGNSEKYLGSGKLLDAAIKKYGRNNFKRETLFSELGLEEAYIKEGEIVNSDFVSREDTYNIAIGGKGGWEHIDSKGINNGFYGKKHSKATKDKISRKLTKCSYPKNQKLPRGGWNRGKKTGPLSENHKSNIAKGMKGKTSGNHNPMWGYEWSTEQKAKLSKRKTGSRNPAAKKIEVEGIVYSTMKEASVKTGISLYRLRKFYLKSDPSA